MSKKKIYIGEDTAEHLINTIKADVQQIVNKYSKKRKEMDSSPGEEDCCFNVVTECHICNGKFKENEKTVSSFLYYSLFASILSLFW